MMITLIIPPEPVDSYFLCIIVSIKLLV